MADISAKRVIIMGVSAGGGVVLSDAIGDRLFVKNGRDTSANAEYYRGAAQIGLSLAAGKLVSKWSMDAGLGLGIGGAGAGVVRIAEKAEIAKKLRNLVDGSGNGSRTIPLPYVAPAAQLPAPAAAAPAAGSGAAQPLTAARGVNNGLGVVTKRVLF